MAKNSVVQCRVETWQKLILDRLVKQYGQGGVYLPAMCLTGTSISDMLRTVVQHLIQYQADMMGVTNLNHLKDIFENPDDNVMTRELVEEISNLSREAALKDVELRTERGVSSALKKRIRGLEDEVSELRAELGID